MKHLWFENRFNVVYLTFQDEAVILEEQSNKNFSCYYLFEIGTKVVCPETPFITIGLSVGSILLIV